MLPELRRRHEAEMRTLADLARRLRSEGLDPQTIARTMNGERRALSAGYQTLTPEPLRGQIAARSIAVHGDPDVPKAQGLGAGGKDWAQITSAAARRGRFPPF